jgi:hypothetical protein
MSTKIKLVIVLLATFLIFFASICAMAFYYYTHPSSVKALLEETLSRLGKTTVNINELSYSLKPLRVRAQGIVLKPLDRGDTFYLEVSELQAELALEGAFADRSLVLRDLYINGLHLRSSDYVSVPRIRHGAEASSLLGKIVRRALALILFRDIKLQAVHLTKGEVVAQLRDQTVRIFGLRGNLSSKHLLELSCGVQIRQTHERISLDIPRVSVTTDSSLSIAKPKISFILAARNGHLVSPEVKAEGMDVKAKIIYSHSSREFNLEPFDLTVAGATLNREDLVFSDLHLQAIALVKLMEARLAVSSFNLTVPDMGQIAGRLEGRLSPQIALEVELLDGHAFPQKLQPFLPTALKQKITGMSMSESIGLLGRISGRMENKTWRWHGDLKARLSNNRFSYHSGQNQFSATLAGIIEAKGNFPFVEVTAFIRADQASCQLNKVKLRPFDARASVSGRYPTFQINELKAEVDQVEINLGTNKARFENIRVRTDPGRLNLEKRSIFLPKILLDSTSIRNIALSLSVVDKRIEIDLGGNQTHILEAAIVSKLTPSGWRFGGLDSIQSEIVLEEAGKLSFTSKLGFRGLHFQSKDESSIGENISIIMEVNGRGQLGSPHIAADVSLDASSGEVLYDRFYLNLVANPFFSQGKLKYDSAKKHLKISNLKVGIREILEIDAEGRVDRQEGDPLLHLSLSILERPLRPLFQHFVLEPFKAEIPALNNLDIGGTFASNLSLDGNRTSWRVMGHLTWRNGVFSLPEKSVGLEGVDLELPIWYQSNLAGGSNNAEKGNLSIKSMLIPSFPEQPLALELHAEPNRLYIESPTVLLVPGGTAQIGPLEVEYIPGSRPFSVETSLSFDAIDISPFLAKIWSNPLEGTMSGVLDPIVLEGDSLGSSGEVKITAFQGEIVLFDLGGSGLFGPVPLLKFGARVEDLSLADITKGTPFGEVRGILRGHVENVEITEGQPQSFDLLLETVEKSGTPQRISIKAVDNIALIGGAQSPFMGAAGILASFFKQLPYKKIGMRASLKNDIFHINGTVLEGNREYLVKRGAFAGVNIINQNPDNRISFKDMVKRVKRVKQGAKAK